MSIGTLQRCQRCGGAILGNWDDPACLSCGAGPVLPRVAGPDDQPRPGGDSRSERRRPPDKACPECGKVLSAWGMGGHRLLVHGAGGTS